MPVELSGRLVFLASPGDMTVERGICRTVIREFNEQSSESQRVVFLLRAWEDMPGGIGRPQDRINPTLDECDYMILILGGRWGSPPAAEGPYSSGTEEELHRCLDLLASPTAAMRDLLVLFRTLEPERLRDPGPQMLEVLNFRNDLDEAKLLQYVNFDSDASLRAAIQNKLAEWARPLSQRKPIQIDLPKRRTIEANPTAASIPQILETAKGYAKKGLLMQAEVLFSQAIEGGDFEAIGEFALFMRRTGRLDAALELNRQIIEDPGLLSSAEHDSVARRVRALVNMGVIHRKRSSLTESIRVLRESVRTAETSTFPVYQELCYALDNYGLSLLRVEQIDLARQQFERTYSIRKEFGAPREIAQSATNLARQSLAREDYGEAATLFEEAYGILQTDNDDHCLANALCGLAEARLRVGVRDNVRMLLERALAVNETLGNSDGTSIAHALLAKYFLAECDVSAARDHAELCHQESERTNSATGYGTSYLLKAMIARQEYDQRAATENLIKAQQFAQSSGNKPLIRDIEAVRHEWTASLAIEAPTGPTPDSARTNK